MYIRKLIEDVHGLEVLLICFCVPYFLLVRCHLSAYYEFNGIPLPFWIKACMYLDLQRN